MDPELALVVLVRSSVIVSRTIYKVISGAADRVGPGRFGHGFGPDGRCRREHNGGDADRGRECRGGVIRHVRILPARVGHPRTTPIRATGGRTVELSQPAPAP